MKRALLCIVLCVTACIGGTVTPVGDGGVAGKDASVQHDLGVSLDDLSQGAVADLTVPRDLSQPPVMDLAAADLTGLFDCYGVAACSPTQMFCMKFHSGSTAAPGTVTSGPACYGPDPACVDNGLPMDCSCIQADANLGLGCQGACVDNMNGTFDCYAKP